MQKITEAIDQGGDTVNVDALKNAIEALVGKDELTRWLRSSAQEMLEEIERMNLVTMAAAQRLVQASIHSIPPRDLGAFTNSIASATMRTAAAAKFREQLPTPTQHSASNYQHPRSKAHLVPCPTWTDFRG